MPFGARRTLVRLALVIAAASAMACGRIGKADYEYEEELYLNLDGSATLNVNASVAALVALRGAPFNPDPAARVDRADVRAFFDGSGHEVTRVSLSRRHRRRFVHVGMNIADVRRLGQSRPFAWSAYRFERRGDVYEYHQSVGVPSGRAVPEAGWTGEELVAFRLHIPSEIPFHNSPNDLQRGNIVEWEQPLAERLHGAPLDLQVHMETESILYSTLILFGSTILAAAATFAAVIWWVARRGRHAVAEPAHERPI